MSFRPLARLVACEAHADGSPVPAVGVRRRVDAGRGDRIDAVGVNGKVGRLQARRVIGGQVHEPPHVGHRVFDRHGRRPASVQIEGVPHAVVVPEQVGYFADLHTVAAVGAVDREQHQRPAILGHADGRARVAQVVPVSSGPRVGERQRAERRRRAGGEELVGVCGVRVPRDRLHAVREDLAGSGKGVPQLHILQDAHPINGVPDRDGRCWRCWTGRC